MPSIKEYFKKKQEKKHVEAYEQKLKRHRKKILIGTITVVALTLAVLIGGSIYLQHKTYSSYKVLSKVENSEEMNTQYAEFNGNILKYTKDGIAYMDKDNKPIWSQTYEMQDPIIDICGNYVAVGDRKGNKIYVADTEGPKGEIDTVIPIQQMKVAAQGVVAAVVEDSKDIFLNLYKKDDSDPVVKIKVSMRNSGYPLDFSISEDGEKLIVSYLNTTESTVKTNIAFYNFGKVGENEIDYLVSSYEYEGIVPAVKFVDNMKAVAFADNNIYIYEGKEKPKEINKISVKDNIRSIFSSDKYIGLVTETGNTDQKYEITLYNLNGKTILQKKFSGEYDKIKIADKQIILLSELDCRVYNINGVEKFKYNFEKELIDFFPVTGINRYIVVHNKEMNQIRLK